MTQAQSYEKIGGLTYSSMTLKDRQKSCASWNIGDVLASMTVLVAIIAAYLYFTG
jgi:SSS family solute:Na+ symporter